MLDTLREAFGWDGDVGLHPGPRGALGQIWRVDVAGGGRHGIAGGAQRFALKEIFAEPPSEASISGELAFSARAIAAGVRVPLSHPDREGRYLITTPDGTWLRLYDWVDVRRVDVTAPGTPERLGVLLARLHLSGAVTSEPVDPWYETIPDPGDWAGLSIPDVVLATIPQLCAAVVPADPAGLIVCHRDLHPENVLAGPAGGGLVVLDWDNFGPAAPGRELACGLFDWFCDGGADLDAMGRMYDAYRNAGGPGRITEAADFSMLVAIRLNFLVLQARLSLDPATEPRHREWAQREVDDTLRILPRPRHLADVLELTRARRA
jgi:Ser/Thr protein kinase RdoA (MazF antagonist)